jgi:S-(hydroxymethyl)glutathione dehydrogenase/alcohol dehydrogenase
MKTTAAILVEQRQPLVVAEVTVPELGYGQVLVEIKTTRICGSQLGEIDGVKGPDRYLPHLLGHEAGGIVREVGPEVIHVKPDDHVVLHWRPGKGIQSRPTAYDWGGKKVNAGNITTFQQFAVVSENRLTPIPKEIDFEMASLLADTLTTGFGVITRDAKVEVGESVVIIGCGGIGLGAVLGASLAGAHPLVAVDIHENKLAAARARGATHTINSSEVDMATAVQEILGGPPDVVIDGTGLPAVIETAYRMTGPCGRCVLFGVMHHEKCISLHTLPLHFGRILTGSEGGQSRPETDIPRFVRMFLDGRFSVEGFVTHRYPLGQINEAIAAMRAGVSLHSMIHFGSP